MITFIVNAISISIVFLLGTVGEILIEKSGHLNLGIPGIMCVGGAGGVFGVYLAMHIGTEPFGPLVILIGVLFAMIFAALTGLIYAFMTITLRCNQNVTGLAITIFGNGFASFFLNSVLNVSDSSVSGILTEAGQNYFTANFARLTEFASEKEWFGNLFLAHGFMVYLAIIIAVIAAVVLSFTKIGLNLRAVGENPGTADAAGINVTAYKYTFNIIGAAIAGLGGLAYIMNYMAGIIGSTVSETIEGIGWLSIALVIFTLWKPALSILGSIIFGAFYIIPSYISVFFPDATFTFAQLKLFPLIPYVITIIVLIITSVRGKKDNQAPASLGLSYFREDR